MTALPDHRCTCTIKPIPMPEGSPLPFEIEEVLSLDCGVPSHAIRARDERIAELEAELRPVPRFSPVDEGQWHYSLGLEVGDQPFAVVVDAPHSRGCLRHDTLESAREKFDRLCRDGLGQHPHYVDCVRLLIKGADTRWYVIESHEEDL